MFSSSSSSFFFLFAADPKVPETVCLSGLISTGAILTTGNYWFPISAFKKKKKKKTLSFPAAAAVARLCPSHRKRSLSRAIYLGAAVLARTAPPTDPLSSEYPKSISHRAHLSHAERLHSGGWEEEVRAANHPRS